MSAKQLNFESELCGQLERFERRLQELGHIGLTLWTRMLRSIAADLIEARQRRDAAIYKQLMLLETQAKDYPELVARIQSIKGLLAVVCLGLSLWSVFELANPVRRATGYRSGGQVRMVVRGKGAGRRELEIV